MAKKSRVNVLGIDPNTISIIDSIKEKKEDGEKVDERTEEAIKAIEMASNVVNSVMEGKYVDVAFFRLFANMTTKKLEKLNRKKVK